jgi:predicted enzyme related to lactoylglutathione lyase
VGRFRLPLIWGSYTIFRLGELDCAACYKLSAAQRERGVPVCWQNYVKVLSADDAALRAKELGGTVVAEAFDVEGVGRMAVLKDPAGVGFSVWQDGLHRGAGTGFQTGAHCWTELMTRQPDQARAFYGGLFGWGAKESDMMGFTYVEFQVDGVSVGGLMPMSGAEWEGVPEHFMQYFTVGDAAASVLRAEELGGKVCVPPAPIPGVGQFAILEDPAGAAFGILQPEGLE